MKLGTNCGFTIQIQDVAASRKEEESRLHTYTWYQQCRIGNFWRIYCLSSAVLVGHWRLLFEEYEERSVGIPDIISALSQTTCRESTHTSAIPIVILHVPAIVNLLLTIQYIHHTAPLHSGRPIKIK